MGRKAQQLVAGGAAQLQGAHAGEAQLLSCCALSWLCCYRSAVVSVVRGYVGLMRVRGSCCGVYATVAHS
jgi:hypothetical protein